MSPALGMIELHRYDRRPSEPVLRVFIAVHRIVSMHEEQRQRDYSPRYVTVTVIRMEDGQTLTVRQSLDHITRLIHTIRQTHHQPDPDKPIAL